MKVTRRKMIQGLAALSSGWGLPLFVPSKLFGANEQIRVGIVGLGGRGAGAHIPGFQNQPHVRVVAICDPDRQRLTRAAQSFQARYGYEVDQYVDMRPMFARKDLDCIGNATQNYWHGLSTIWACQAGKHVYVEKPLAHYIWEGRQMVHAARRYGRIVQCGTQRRSQQSIAEAIRWIREGHLGPIQYIVAFANKPRRSCGKRETPLPIPPTLDYDLWCGPAQMVPIYRENLQYDCSFDWNTGDGESCNQGVHEIDVARWCLGEERYPRRVMSIGGRFVFNDACNTPNTQIIYYDFATAPVLYEVHNLPVAKGASEMPNYRGEAVGVIVECEGGSVSLYRGIAWDREGKELVRFAGGGDHFVNFTEAVRSGRPEILKADVEVGHYSTAVCHFGNISYRVGRVASEAEQRAAVAGIPHWEEMYERFVAHLKAHEVDPGSATLGPWLEIDAEKEQVRDHEEANRIVRGWYRPPYEVPDLSACSA